MQRNQKKGGHRCLQENAPPEPASQAGAGWPGAAREDRNRNNPNTKQHNPNHNNPKTNKPNPGRHPGHPVLLPQTKEGRQSGVKSAVQPWQPGGHAGKGTRRGPHPTTKNHTTTKHASPPANNQAVPRHANHSDAVKHKLKNSRLPRGGAVCATVRDEVPLPSDMMPNPQLMRLKSRGLVPWQRRQRRR